MLDSDGNLPVSLYRALLFIHVMGRRRRKGRIFPRCNDDTTSMLLQLTWDWSSNSITSHLISLRLRRFRR